ncbi:MAG: phosphoglycerate dehydrogenase [Candidatus Firestonebacteria bacterium]
MNKNGKILITPRSLTKSGHPALDTLKKAGYELVFSTPGKQPDEKELIELLSDCVGYLAGVEKISAEVLKGAGKLKVISRNGTGIDNIDLKTAKELNIKICRAEEANTRGVAELTIGLIFSLVRYIPFSDRKMKEEKWERKEGIELQNRTLGIIGCGKIGRQVAMMALSLGMKVVAYDVIRDSSFLPAGDFSWADLNTLLKQSDIISLHCPPLKNGESLINKDIIEKMKNGVYLINAARADLIDEKAVLKALFENKIAGFALDVFKKEPPVDNPLVLHERVIATPHIGGYTNESISRATQIAVNNLLKYLS